MKVIESGMNQDRLIEEMGKIVDKYVKAFKEDFSKYDVDMIRRIKNDGKPIRMVWIARTCGTQFFDEEEEHDNYGKTVLSYYNNFDAISRVYLIKFDGNEFALCFVGLMGKGKPDIGNFKEIKIKLRKKIA